jgi:hypothetical protein
MGGRIGGLSPTTDGGAAMPSSLWNSVIWALQRGQENELDVVFSGTATGIWQWEQMISCAIAFLI